MHAGPVYHSCFFEGPLYEIQMWGGGQGKEPSEPFIAFEPLN